MKKTTLWITAVPAILLTVACGATSNNQSSKANKLIRSNGTETAVNIFCKDCLISEVVDEEEGKYSSVFIEKFNADDTTHTFKVETDETKPYALLPGQIDFKIDGETASSGYTYKMLDKTNKTAELSFTLPSAPPYGTVDVIIDANTACMDFVVSLDTLDYPDIEFKFNGALNRVDWDDGSTPDQTTTHSYTQLGDHHVKVYGNISSVWFTKKEELSSNNVPLMPGNNNISKISFNHSITTLPSYAFDGCTGLEQTYIGDSVTSIGEKVFVLNDLEQDPEATHNVIYSSKTSAPKGWSENWTDCPVCYGIPTSESEDGADEATGLKFKLINVNVKGVNKSRALIVGSKTSGGTNALTIPAQVDFESNKIDVYGIAPFAFYHMDGQNIKTITINATNFAEFGDYAFARTGISQINVKTIQAPDLPFLRFGRRAFWNVRGGQFDLDFAKLKVTSSHELIIDEESFCQSNITGVIIPDGSFQLKTINKGAFKVSALKQIINTDKKFPSSVTTIKEEALANCYSFHGGVAFDIPKTVQTIEKNAFIGCTFNSIRVAYEEDKKPTGWKEGWNYKKEQTEWEEPEFFAVVWGFIKEITHEASGMIYDIVSSKGVEQATLVGFDSTIIPEPQGISIPDSISDPDTGKPYDIVAIGDRAFQNCSSLKTIFFSQNSKVTKIGEYAFENCSALSAVTIPASVKEVGKGAFAIYDEYPELVIFYKGSAQDAAKWDPEWDGDESSIGAALYTDFDFDYDPASLDNTNFNVATKQGTLDASISKYVSTNKSVAIPDKITNTKLEAKPTYNITSIGDKSFMQADLSEGIDFSNAKSLTTIGSAAFAGATLFGTETEPLSLPSTITKIGKHAFYHAQGVESIDISNTSITEIPDRAFSGNTESVLSKINVPSSVSKLGTGAFEGLENLETVDLSANTSITEIPRGLFQSCISYTGIDKLPTSIQTIGEYSFAGTAITSADLSSTQLVSTSECAFAGCANLVSAVFPATLNPATGLASRLFEECSAMKTIDLSAIENDVVQPGETFFGKRLPEAFGVGGEGKIYVHDKDLLAKYLDSQSLWRKLFGDDIANHIVVKE